MVPVKPTLTSTAGFVSTFDRLGLLLGMLTRYIVSGVVDVMDSIVPDGSPAFIGSHNQPGDEPL